MRSRRWAVVSIVSLLLVSCGSDSDSEPPAAVESTAATTTEATTSTTTPGLETELADGFRYHDLGAPFADKSGAIDVVAPTEGNGPWPTVIMFHGDPWAADKDWHKRDARLIAEHGRVVFLPSWGHRDPEASPDMSRQDWWNKQGQQASCAVAYAKAHTAEFGGDPDHITLAGFSGGGNQVLTAGLKAIDPLDTCAVEGGAVAVQALVPIDADWVLGPVWDQPMAENPEDFYLITPWRQLDGSQDLRIHVTIAENPGLTLDAGSLVTRHIDIDLVAELDKRGFLADGEFSLRESSEYAFEVLQEAGYDVTFVVMTGASHNVWGDEGRAIVVDTVVNAEG